MKNVDKIITVGSDHAGYRIKEKIKEYLSGEGYAVNDCGCFSEESVDYPDYAHAIAGEVSKGQSGTGILVCGSGNGVCMTANRHSNVRAALCWKEELASLARKHNDANVLCLPGRFIDGESAIKIVKTFLETAFEGERHSRRVAKIDNIGPSA
ncbi:MAG: ribose 5-phosphate isomerase B [Bacteroidetes bacterium]|nr:ribose 5-phosphate isomerase B [Bacteroidota bacterium]